jgi:hypothetical protein
MDLTNRLLRRVNDVEISEADFPSARGIQAVAKDCVLDTVREINSSRIDWPFNAVEHSQNLIIGVEEYPWPLQFTAADWNSFQLQKDDSLDISYEQLTAISREEWYTNYRDTDYNSGTIGRGVPTFCFPSHGQGWGVSPSPNKAYPIKYRYYKNPADLVNYNDQVTIPDKFDYVILAGALMHMNLFKENPQGVAIAKKNFDDGIRDMVNMFLPNPIYVYDGRVNFGGGDRSRNGYYFYKGGL